MSKSTPRTSGTSLDRLVEIFEKTHQEAQTRAIHSANSALVIRNWLYGYYIVEFEGGAADHKELYGKKLLQKISTRLTQRGVKGVSQTSLKQYRLFYLTYKKIGQTLSDQSFSPSFPDNLFSAKYVNYFDRYAKLKEENPTIGTILCKKKNDALVEIPLPKEANIHASEYKLFLPSKEELQRQLRETEEEFETQVAAGGMGDDE